MLFLIERIMMLLKISNYLKLTRVVLYKVIKNYLKLNRFICRGWKDIRIESRVLYIYLLQLKRDNLLF